MTRTLTLRGTELRALANAPVTGQVMLTWQPDGGSSRTDICTRDAAIAWHRAMLADLLRDEP